MVSLALGGKLQQRQLLEFRTGPGRIRDEPLTPECRNRERPRLAENAGVRGLRTAVVPVLTDQSANPALDRLASGLPMKVGQVHLGSTDGYSFRVMTERDAIKPVGSLSHRR